MLATVNNPDGGGGTMNGAGDSSAPLVDEPSQPQPAAMVVARQTSGSNVMSFVYNFGKKLGTVMAVYLLGYFNFSAAWMLGPLLVCVMREEWKKEGDLKREVAKASALCNEKDVVLARVSDLPSWVFFPDVERAEWLNRIMKIVWPNVNHYVRDLLKDTIEPNLQASMAPYKMGDFKFERIILGSIPPRIGGVKVYDRNVSRSEIIMDLDIFYAGDCDITFTVKGMKGGIKDFQIHGMLRVVMRPLITKIPFVGGLQVFFLNNPDVDFNLVGVVDVLDLPGLRDVLHRIIIEQVAAMMVLPNKLPISLSEDVPAQVLRTPEPEGVLRVHLVEAKDLMKMDIGVLGKGKSDPYAIINVGAQSFKTPIIDNTVNPKWDFWCEMLIDAAFGQSLNIVLYDDDDPKKDDFLGRATIDIASIAQKGEIDMWVTLEDAKHGKVHLRFSWHVLSSDPVDLKAALNETQLLRLTHMSSSIFMIYVDSCKMLPNARASSKPDPYLVLTLGSKQEQTCVVMRSADPVWEQGFTFLVHNPEADTLTIKVMDQKTGGEIGRFVYNLVILMEKKLMEIQSQPFQLKQSGPESKIILAMQLRILKRWQDEKKTATNEKEKAKLTKQMSEPVVNKPVSGLHRDASVKSEGGNLAHHKETSHESLHSLPSLPEGSPVRTVAPVQELMSSMVANVALEAIPGMELRRRGASSPTDAGEFGLGVIQLTLRYSVARQRLVVVVHKINNLPLKDPTNIPDPYVKLHLLPERSRESKRKTEVIKDNCNPVYDETFEYVISEGELSGRELEVSVVTRKGLFSSSPVMGQVIITLADLDLGQGSTRWFDLAPQRSKDA